MNIDDLTIGCIGCGNIGSAILSGLNKNGFRSLMGYDPKVQNLTPLEAIGIKAAKNLEHLSQESDIIIVAVKPLNMDEVLQQIAPLLTEDKILISVAAGISLNTLKKGIQNKCTVVRCMPNTPALVGAGIFAFCCEDPSLDERKKSMIFSLFESIGMCIELPEEKFTAYTAYMGAGPAYVFHLMNSLVQAGVTLGFSRKDSRHMVEKLVESSVLMSKTSEQNLTELRDNVCSPAGLTLAGINHMERTGVGGHIIDAVLAAHARGIEMES